jgi:polysaccharide export outer membrane protein
MKKNIPIFCLIVLSLHSCTSPKQIEKSYQLFQAGLDSIANYSYKELTIKQGDNLTIQVYTLATADQQQVALFNLPSAEGKSSTGSSGGASAGSYLVSNSGEIFLPKIGMFKVEGLTCSQLKEKVTKEWGVYVKDIVVDVKMTGFHINIFGEVKAPGIIRFPTQQATLFDALASAGSFTDDAKRKEIILIREDSGRRKSYEFDLTTAKVYESPVFQLQQNDLIYVGAGTNKFKNIANGRFATEINPILTISSLLFSVVNFAFIIIALSK